jgi:riboflavin transporter FmnP
MSNKTKAITRTGVLLALTLVFQLLGRNLIPFIGQNSNFVVGPLVNACLLISTASVGLWSGSLIAVIAPFAAFLTGAATPLPFVPFIAAGNFLLVVCFFSIKKNYYIGTLVGAFAKFGFLTVSINFFLNMFQDDLNIPQGAAKNLSTMFSYPQLITALLGGTIALSVIKSLGKNIEI